MNLHTSYDNIRSEGGNQKQIFWICEKKHVLQIKQEKEKLIMLNIAVIGLGQMGTHHARIYAGLPGVKLSAVCEADQDRREAACREFQCAGYADYHELLADPKIDAVSITLPDNMHLDVVKTAVEHQKHILLEKPIAKELPEGRELYELTKEYPKVFTVGHLLRFDPRFCAVKEAIENKELGDLIHLYCRRNSPITGPMRYIGASDLSMHVMIHDIDYINWFLQSRPVKVYAKSRSVALKQYGMNDVIYALVTYENGVVACMEACWTLPKTSPTIIDDQMELVGTKGTAYIDACDKGVRLVTAEHVLYPDSRHWPYVNGAPAGDLKEEISSFVSCIETGKKPVISAYEAYQALCVVDAIERSIKEGREVDVVE